MIFQIERLDLVRAPCFGHFNEVSWAPESKLPNETYTLSGCERLRYNITGEYVDQQRSSFLLFCWLAQKFPDFPCQPACSELYYKISYSESRHSSPDVGITLTVMPTVTYMHETRKTTLIDILCKFSFLWCLQLHQFQYQFYSSLLFTGYLGGASSLFMGCSCVTLMEMFVFLFKLVTTSICSEDPPEPDDSFYQEKFAFEYSDHRNKRRYAICDKGKCKTQNLC